MRLFMHGFCELFMKCILAVNAHDISNIIILDEK